ncbi:MAG: hypothetical protein WA936_04390 [Erythrobacter sp.]
MERLSALEIERVIAEAVRRWVPKADNPFTFLRSVHLAERGLQVTLDTGHCSTLAARLSDDESILDRPSDSVMISLPILFPARGYRKLVVPTRDRAPQPDPVMIAALRKAHAMLRTERGMPLIDAAPRSPYDRFILGLALLAPDIQRAPLEGRHPPHLNLESLKGIDLPLEWTKQRELLGIGESDAPCSADKIA